MITINVRDTVNRLRFKAIDCAVVSTLCIVWHSMNDRSKQPTRRCAFVASDGVRTEILRRHRVKRGSRQITDWSEDMIVILEAIYFMLTVSIALIHAVCTVSIRVTASINESPVQSMGSVYWKPIERPPDQRRVSIDTVIIS